MIRRMLSRILWSAALVCVVVFALSGLGAVAQKIYSGRIHHESVVRGDVILYWNRQPIEFALTALALITLGLGMFLFVRPILRKIMEPDKRRAP